MDNRLIFNSASCEKTAADLNTAAVNLDKLHDAIDNLLNNVLNMYSSPAADDMKKVYDSMEEPLQQMKEAVSQCSRYLIEVVKEGYERIEKAAMSKIQ